MKIWSHDSANWQHNNKPLVFAAWGDNNSQDIVKFSRAGDIVVGAHRESEEERQQWKEGEVVTGSTMTCSN
jgi:hypothetical protein